LYRTVTKDTFISSRLKFTERGTYSRAETKEKAGPVVKVKLVGGEESTEEEGRVQKDDDVTNKEEEENIAVECEPSPGI